MDKILFVDDERTILSTIERALKKKYNISMADSAEKGLACIEKEGPFAVVVSDFQMPQMDGVAFLSEVNRISPDTVRMMLTGCAEIETTIRAVNEGNIFRFLSKPCPIKVLDKALNDGLNQYNLIQTKRDYYALIKWNESLDGLIQAFVRLIESKDPYTAGHQSRVAKFSGAIAQELDYSKDEVEQIKMAAVIHDIGKIYIPVEFLNKPGTLNEMEWNIIRMHSQIGHDILESIKFPFPIHKIVRQHHERENGSGYPDGLKGSEILREAKIIAVADVVEAIAHHRPYRPAKGLNKAIAELKEYRGVHFDAEISDVALSILSGREFSFE